ncbi:MAG: bifunctional methylenetetrahydrofolate dehydrogenase/methenyltetrahydrofolate cyclohydrolase FolD [Kiritimatiellaeota bacterium]|nr:bifunctional methylenetetrahydrofolate dehydrogenase/methenyltetrahydrofolate cyclohydrolase FolD [Kiritimatiellota bacterium]
MKTATLLDGKKLAASLRADIAAQVAELKAKHGITPGLGVILIGADPASVSYVTAKEKACGEAGIHSQSLRVPAETTQDEALALVRRMNADPLIHGILVQLPLPRHIAEEAVINAIAPEKDVDGFTPVNVGRMMIGEDCFLPCTPHGIIQMLISAGVEVSGKHAVVVGRSNIVGKPVAHLLMRKAPGGNATVTVCHTATRDLPSFTRRADILVVAAGRAGTVTGDMVKPGAVVIDVGVNRIPDATKASGFRLVGDVDFDSAAEVASLITPVPGGVGPMTITMLLHNTLQAAQRKKD